MANAALDAVSRLLVRMGRDARLLRHLGWRRGVRRLLRADPAMADGDGVKILEYDDEEGEGARSLVAVLLDVLGHAGIERSYASVTAALPMRRNDLDPRAAPIALARHGL